jgi:hypothetical protein
MNPTKLLCTMAIGLSAAACNTYSTTTTQAVARPGPGILTNSEQACLDYGFPQATIGYDRCVTREREARLRGRVVATYSEVQLADDARSACYSYGLEPATPRYDRCVNRELDARRYRDGVAYNAPAPGYTTVTTYSTQNVNPAPYYAEPVQNSPPAGVQAFKDEFGFRYDGQGNRLDRNGNIISPQSTQP